MFTIIIFFIILYSVILHEISHAAVAYWLGDSTAKDEGRITLNPIPHISLFGTIVLPFFLIMLNTGFVVGWAKPVPYNPYNMRWKHGSTLVALAGPLANILIAFVCVALYHALPGLELTAGALLADIMKINLFLAFLNLIPIPPLDGYKILSSLLPMRYRMRLETSFYSSGISGLLGLIAVFIVFVFFLSEWLVLLTGFIMRTLL